MDVTAYNGMAPPADDASAARCNRTERALLALAGVFIAVNTLALLLVQGRWSNLMEWLPLLVWVACAAISHALLARFLPARDPFLLPVAMFLSGWGIVIIDRVFPVFADRQTTWLIVANGGLLVAALTPYLLRWLRGYRYTLLIFGLGLLLATILFGSNPSGQRGAPELWLGFGTVYFQPSEALKIILVAFLASYLAEHYPILRSSVIPDQRRFVLPSRVIGPILLMWGLSVVVLVWQRDLGTAALFFMVFLILLYIATGYTSVVIAGAALTLIAAVVAYQAFSVVEQRIDIWLDPWADPDGRAYQIVQSLMAFAAGGVFGQGVGQGFPGIIPVVHSDFIFAALAEEWGLLGVFAVLMSIALLIWRGLRVALIHADRPFYALLAIGLVSMLAVQSLFIMGGVIKLFPLTGVTLPFMSYGGSSLLVCYVTLGLLLRLSSGQQQGHDYAVHS